MPRAVLLAVDAGREAEVAFDWYLQHIHRPGNNIVILHSVDLSALTAEDDDTSSRASFDQERGRIKELDNKYRWKLNENGLAGKIRTESGKPGDVIIKVAAEEKAGFIVIGSRGLSKLKRTIGESVSDYVLHHAKCPVIICKQKE